jgi:hypothetical protein
MKLATYNVNGVNGRLPVLLRWLEQAKPDVACLQELKAPEEKFPVAAIEKAGYGAIWHGQKSWNGVAILARGQTPEETRRGLPGDPEDLHSRYIETRIDGLLIGCLYLPTVIRHPARNSTTSLPGSNDSRGMRKGLSNSMSQSSLLAITTSSLPRWMLISRSAGWTMHCFFLSRGPHTKTCSPKAEPTLCAGFIPTRPSTRSGTISATPSLETPASASTIFC